jgi:hypothetical protein
MNRRWVGSIILLSLGCASLLAQSTSPSGENYPGRGEYLQIKLVTIEPGDELTMWWGHTAIIVEDLRFNTSLFYNYGIFSFEQENFIRNFVMGRLIFWVGAWSTHAALDYYKSQNRTIRMQILDLPPERRLEMARFLGQNVLPENREYLYDHYYDNCATRVRDLIDKMVDGQFARFCHQPARMTLRQHTRCYTHHHFLMDLLLMFLMNDTIDKPATRWQEMFLPIEVERNIQAFNFADSSGAKRKLVSDDLLFFEASQQPPIPDFAPRHWPVTLALGGILAMLGLYLAFLYRQHTTGSKYLFGMYQTLLGLIFGIPGLALFFMANFTNHTVTYHNENLYLASPLTLLLIYSGIRTLRHESRKQSLTLYLCSVLAFLGTLSLLLKIFPAFDQDNWDIISLLLPIWLTLAGSWFWIIKKSPA